MITRRLIHVVDLTLTSLPDGADQRPSGKPEQRKTSHLLHCLGWTAVVEEQVPRYQRMELILINISEL